MNAFPASPKCVSVRYLTPFWGRSFAT